MGVAGRRRPVAQPGGLMLGFALHLVCRWFSFIRALLYEFVCRNLSLVYITQTELNSSSDHVHTNGNVHSARTMQPSSVSAGYSHGSF